MARVFVLGTAVVDFILSVDSFSAEGNKTTADDARIVGGGCAANAAVAIERLGGDATLAARFGQDAIADLVLSELAAEGVRTDIIYKSSGARSSFSSVLIDSTGARQIVNFRGSGLTEKTDWLIQMPAADAILVDSRWTNGALFALEMAKKRGIYGIVDAEAPVDPAILARASHVAFSRQGLLSLSSETEPTRALQDIADRVPGWVCVTDGENGVYHATDKGIEHISAFKVDVRDTLGAGDIWHGAFALRLAEGAAEDEAIVFANAAAALKCMVFGGRSGCPDRSATEKFLRENST
jgi:sulfofructose kinase